MSLFLGIAARRQQTTPSNHWFQCRLPTITWRTHLSSQKRIEIYLIENPRETPCFGMQEMESTLIQCKCCVRTTFSKFCLMGMPSLEKKYATRTKDFESCSWMSSLRQYWGESFLRFTGLSTQSSVHRYFFPSDKIDEYKHGFTIPKSHIYTQTLSTARLRVQSTLSYQ